jgi:hypothetical protein
VHIDLGEVVAGCVGGRDRPESQEVADLLAFLGSDEASFCTAVTTWSMGPTPPTEAANTPEDGLGLGPKG